MLVANGAEFSRRRSTSTVTGGDTLVEVERAAKRLGIPRNTLYSKMRKHGIRA